MCTTACNSTKKRMRKKSKKKKKNIQGTRNLEPTLIRKNGKEKSESESKVKKMFQFFFWRLLKKLAEAVASVLALISGLTPAAHPH